MFRLVAFDLDNTLVGPDLALSPRVKAAIAKAQAQGTLVTIATGRGPSPTDQFAAALDLHAPLVCFQGGLVYDYRARRILHETRLDPDVVPSHPILVEGLPRGMSKAVGLAWLADYYHLKPAEVMAMGDNDNDAEMLNWAGLGVAMRDGSPAALAAADEVVPSVSEDGAAIALERYGLA